MRYKIFADVSSIIIYWVTISFLFLTAACNSSSDYSSKSGRIPDNIRYNLHIRPILSDKCFVCHGPDANKSLSEKWIKQGAKYEAFAAPKKPELPSVKDTKWVRNKIGHFILAKQEKYGFIPIA